MKSKKVLGGGSTSSKFPFVFKERYVNEFDAFVRYYNTICSNGYILDITKELDNMESFCDLFSNITIFNQEPDMLIKSKDDKNVNDDKDTKDSKNTKKRKDTKESKVRKESKGRKEHRSRKRSRGAKYSKTVKSSPHSPNDSEEEKPIKLIPQINLEYEPFPDEMKNAKLLFASNFVELKTSAEKGRHLVAARNIPKDLVLINEIPTVLQVAPVCLCVGNSITSLYRCHHCGTSISKFYVCDGCNVCTFCSRGCQNDAFKEYHAYECFGFQRHFWSMDTTDYSYISFRMMLYGASKGFDTDINNSVYGNCQNNYPFVYGLESHFMEIPKHKINKILYSSVRNLLYLRNKTTFFTGISDKPNFEDLFFYMGGLMVKHYCQAQFNNVNLTFPNLTLNSGLNVPSGSGKAICPTIALINHACAPNATLMVYSNYIVVRNIKPIQKGEEITLCYSEVNAFFNLAERRLITEQLLNFTCNCSLCVLQENAIEAPYKCPQCQKGNAQRLNTVSELVGLCIRCFKTFSFDPIMKHLKRAAKYKSEYLAQFGLEPLTKMVECYKRIFPPHSVQLLDLYKLMYEKNLLWGVRPFHVMKYGLLVFRTIEQGGIHPLYIPFICAKLTFMAKVVDLERLYQQKNVTAEEYEIAGQFLQEVLKFKEILMFYLPEYLMHQYMYILTKANIFYTVLRCK